MPSWLDWIGGDLLSRTYAGSTPVEGTKYSVDDSATSYQQEREDRTFPESFKENYESKNSKRRNESEDSNRES